MTQNIKAHCSGIWEADANSVCNLSFFFDIMSNVQIYYNTVYTDGPILTETCIFYRVFELGSLICPKTDTTALATFVEPCFLLDLCM